MTTPSDADDAPDRPEPAWAPPDAQAAGPPPDPDPPAPEPPAGPRPPDPVRARTNRLAIGALATGLLGLVPFALGLGIAALVQAGRRAERGRGLAVGGFAASAAWVVAGVAVVLAGAPGDPAGSESRGGLGQPRASTLQPGTCFHTFEDRDPALFMRQVPCATGHEGEIAARASLPDGPFPGETAVRVRAEKLCHDRTRFMEETGRAHEFMLHTDRPGRKAWESGDRTVTCALRYVGPSILRESLQELRTGERSPQYLVPGNCISTWEDLEWPVVVECTEKYRIQVYGFVTVRGEKFPSRKKMDEQAVRLCTGHAAKLWKVLPRRDLDLVHLTPDRAAWQDGDRRITCMLEIMGDPQQGSLLPK